MTPSLLIICSLGLIPLKQSSLTAVDKTSTHKPVPLSPPGKFGSVIQPFSTALATKPGRMSGRRLPISPTTLQVSPPYTATLCTACCSRHAVILVCWCIQSKCFVNQILHSYIYIIFVIINITSQFYFKYYTQYY